MATLPPPPGYMPKPPSPPPEEQRWKPNQLQEGIILYQRSNMEPERNFEYEVENKLLLELEIDLDFSSSTNLHFSDDSTKRRVATIQPHTRTHIGKLVMLDQDGAASLKLGLQWTLKPASPEAIHHILLDERNKFLEMIKYGESLGFGNDSLSMNDLERICQENNIHFIDPEFPPIEESIYKKNSRGKMIKTAPELQWRLPTDIMQGEINLFDGIEPNDIIQGNLGNCYFLSALACLTEYPGLIEKLFINTAYSPHGIYQIRFCNRKWTVVTIDDYIPCIPSAGPIYSKSNENEIYIQLLEKAYSKLNGGSFHAIRAGSSLDALIDLTGSPYRQIKLQDKDNLEYIVNGGLFADLEEYDSKGYLMSVSISSIQLTNSESNIKNVGLISGHAYSLISVIKLSSGVRLMKIRNPWGNFEWNGDWSDESSLWTPAIDVEIGGRTQADDGIFYMCYEDFIKYFNKLAVIYVKHRGENENITPWYEMREKVTFLKSNDNDSDDDNDIKIDDNISSFDITSDLMYKVKIDTPTTMYFSVHQEDERCECAPAYIDLGIVVIRSTDEINEHINNGTISEIINNVDVVGYTGPQAQRQSQVTGALDIGEYIVIPLTTGCMLGDQTSIPPYKRNEPESLSEKIELFNEIDDKYIWRKELEVGLNRIFERWDLDLDGLIGKSEMNKLLELMNWPTLDDSKNEWENILNKYDSKHSKGDDYYRRPSTIISSPSPDKDGITADGWRDWWKDLWLNNGQDDNIIWSYLECFGYNRQLILSNARTIVLAIHSEELFEVDPISYNHHLSSLSQASGIKKFGKCSQFDGGNLCLYTQTHGSLGVSFAVENNCGRAVKFALDCSSSTNARSHTGTLVHEEVINNSGLKTFLHIISEPTAQQWQWGLSASCQMI